ncbi:MAG TPA: hypothetical protein VEA61_04775 [Allosphingosinicella sp.]|nr:hypothetical protein [Allosphingosinicella sp.]
MRFPSNAAIFMLGATLITGCAELKIYDHENLGRQNLTGIPFYISKPYLLVARTGAKDKPVDVSVVYIPNLAKPLYAKIQPGFGSSKTNLAFSNSILTSVGQETDTQVDELLTSLGTVGGIPGSLATAAKTRRETSLLGNESAPDYATVATQLASVAAEVRLQVEASRQANVLTGNERTALSTVATILEASATKLRDPTQAEAQLARILIDLNNAAKNWDGQVRDASAATSGPELAIRRQLAAARKELQAAIDALSPKKGDPPTFTLYEIDNSSGKTVLTEVPF